MRPSDSNNSKTPEHDDMHLWLSDKDNLLELASLVLYSYESFKPYGEYEANMKVYDLSQWNIEDKTVVKQLQTIRPKILKIEREVPVKTGNYIQGICDALLTFTPYMRDVFEEHVIGPVLKEDGTQQMENGKRLWDLVDIKNVSEHERSCCSECITDYGYYEDDKSEPVFKYKMNHFDKKMEQVDHDHNPRTNIIGIMLELKPKLNSISGIMGQLKIYRDSLKLKYTSHSGFNAFFYDYNLMILTYDLNTKYDKILESEDIAIVRIDKDSGKIINPPKSLDELFWSKCKTK